MKVSFEFECGDECRDVITEFQGVVTAQFYFINGCKRYEIEAPGEKAGGKGEYMVVDEGRLKRVQTKKAREKAAKGSVEPKPTGGPRRSPSVTGSGSR